MEKPSLKKRCKLTRILMIIVIMVVCLSGILTLKIVSAAANAASLYCEKMNEEFGGYSYKVVSDSDGNQKGVCVLPNNQEVEAWDFFNGKIASEFSYCSRKGFSIETVRGGTTSSEQALCVIPQYERVMFLDLLSGMEKIPVLDFAGLTEENTEQISEVFSPENPPKDSPPGGFFSEYNALDYSFWDWRSPPSNTRYSKQNFVYSDEDGWLTAVKDQGNCKSCWAFGVLGTLESKYNIQKQNTRLNPDLSEQNLVSDCCTNCGNCSSGSRYTTFDYIKNTGISDERCFAYREQDSQCLLCQDYSSRLWQINDYKINSYPTTNQIKQTIIDNGPISAILSWGGSFDENCVYRCYGGSSGDHIIVLLGYNETGNLGTSYWIAKNSFGTGWPGLCNMGEGYFKIGFDECNIGSVIYPVQINNPNYKPRIVLNSPSNAYISDVPVVNFNFVTYARNSSQLVCSLIINEIERDTAIVNSGTASTFSFRFSAGNYPWKIRCWEKGFGIDNESETRMLVINVPDLDAPEFFSESKTSIVAGKPSIFSITWQDNIALSPGGQYIFSFDNCNGVFTNDSPRNFAEKNLEEVHVTKILENRECLVRYKWYASDNLKNWNVTQIYTFNSIKDDPAIVNLGTPVDKSEANSTDVLFSCSASDDKNVLRIELYNNASGWNLMALNENCSNSLNPRNCLLSYFASLEEGRAYKWNCLSIDSSGQKSWNADNHSISVLKKDSAPIVLSKDLVIGDNYASLKFRTDELSDSLLEYGKTQVFADTSKNSNFSIDHVFNLENLERGSEYYADLSICDIMKNCRKISYTFKTSSSSSLFGTWGEIGESGGREIACLESDKRCSGNMLQQCRSNGWRDSEFCSYACDPYNFICIQRICYENNRRCSGNTLQECRGNSWVLLKNCARCDSNLKDCAVISCYNGEKKCSDDGKSLLECQNSLWESKSCKDGCNSTTFYCEEIEESPKISFSSIIIILIIVFVAGLILYLIKIKKDYDEGKNARGIYN